MTDERDIEQLRQENAELHHALSRLVHWFGPYPELVPSVEVFDKMRADMTQAKALVGDATPATTITDKAAIIDIAARIFRFKPHKQTEETKAEYIAFAKEMFHLYSVSNGTLTSLCETGPRHPMQPLVKDEHGTVRFKRNAIVKHLIQGKQNDIAMMDFSDEDRVQVAQLIGYSVSGFSDLSYVSDADCERAEAQPVHERE